MKYNFDITIRIYKLCSWSIYEIPGICSQVKKRRCSKNTGVYVDRCDYNISVSSISLSESSSFSFRLSLFLDLRYFLYFLFLIKFKYFLNIFHLLRRSCVLEERMTQGTSLYSWKYMVWESHEHLLLQNDIDSLPSKSPLECDSPLDVEARQGLVSLVHFSGTCSVFKHSSEGLEVITESLLMSLWSYPPNVDQPFGGTVSLHILIWERTIWPKLVSKTSFRNKKN